MAKYLLPSAKPMEIPEIINQVEFRLFVQLRTAYNDKNSYNAHPASIYAHVPQMGSVGIPSMIANAIHAVRRFNSLSASKKVAA